MVTEKARILIIDSSEDICLRLTHVLTERGYETEAVRSGPEALEKVRQRFFNLALLDIQLPGRSCVEHIALLREAQPDLAVAVLTTRATLSTAMHSLNKGTSAYIIKPLNVDEALFTVKETLEKQRLVMENRHLLAQLQRERAGKQELALQNAHSLEEGRRRTQQLEIMHQAGMQLISSLEPGQVLEAILQFALQLVDAVDAHVFLYDGQKLSFGAALWANEKQRQADQYEPRPGGLTETVARSGKSLVIEDVDSHPLFENWKWGGAIVGLPLTTGSRVLGVMTVAFNRPRTFEEDELRLLQFLAAQAAVALDNARLFNETRGRAEELATLVRVSSALRSAETQSEMLNIILDEVYDLLEAEGAALALSDLDAGDTVIRLARGAWSGVAGLRLPVGQAITERVLDSGQPYLESSTPGGPPSRRPNPLGDLYVAACVPLNAQDEVMGVLWVGREEGFTQDEVQLLTAIGDIAANAIQRAALYEETLRHAAELERRVARRTADLTAANAELLRAVRAKDEFLSHMSHELRTPLNNVLIRVQMLQEGMLGVLTEKQTRSLRIVEISSRHLLELINDILDVTKVEAGTVELDVRSVSAESLCQASVQHVRDLARKKQIHLATKVEPTVLQADQRRLQQILVNLLTNAVKFTPEGGQVDLEVATDSGQGFVHFIVRDTGIGIPREDVARIFEPFSQLNSGLVRRYEGTGLGLTLVRRLTEMHGGSASVESEVGQGSRFVVSLPWSPPDLATGGEEKVAGGLPEHSGNRLPLEVPSRGRQVTILLAEDDEGLSSGLAEYLSLEGYRVVIARHGSEAIERAKEERPDLILMDNQMPGMDGPEAIRRLRADADLAAVPIIALTGLTMPGDREKCITAGADECLSKPVGPEALKEVIVARMQQLEQPSTGSS